MQTPVANSKARPPERRRTLVTRELGRCNFYTATVSEPKLSDKGQPTEVKPIIFSSGVAAARMNIVKRASAHKVDR